MSEILMILNNVAVSVFGCVLSAAFCGLGKTRKSRLQIAAVILGLLLLQGLYYTLGSRSVRRIYPLLTHLPLILLLCCLTKQKLWACSSVFLAYLCCQIRRWLALMIVWIIQGGETEQAIIEILLTVPILLLLLKFVAPSAQGIARLPWSVQAQFCLIPVLYYAFDYLTIVYTDWLYSGIPAVVEFMPFVCCGAYLLSMLRIWSEEERYHELERDRDSLNLQVAQSVRELEALREAQLRAAAYRHDLRHHLQYLSGCLENGNYAQAQDYIHTINREIDAQKVIPYCENEPANLILSAYVARAARAGVDMQIRVALGPILGIAANDLCVLLSNGLENALQACARLPKGAEKPCVRVQGYEKGGKVYLQISNPCPWEVPFRNGLPLSRREGHGMGTRSIQSLVKRYGGVCSFTVEKGWFLLRASL